MKVTVKKKAKMTNEIHTPSEIRKAALPDLPENSGGLLRAQEAKKNRECCI